MSCARVGGQGRCGDGVGDLLQSAWGGTREEGGRTASETLKAASDQASMANLNRIATGVSAAYSHRRSSRMTDESKLLFVFQAWSFCQKLPALRGSFGLYCGASPWRLAAPWGGEDRGSSSRSRTELESRARDRRRVVVAARLFMCAIPRQHGPGRLSSPMATSTRWRLPPTHAHTPSPSPLRGTTAAASLHRTMDGLLNSPPPKASGTRTKLGILSPVGLAPAAPSLPPSPPPRS